MAQFSVITSWKNISLSTESLSSYNNSYTYFMTRLRNYSVTYSAVSCDIIFEEIESVRVRLHEILSSSRSFGLENVEVCS